MEIVKKTELSGLVKTALNRILIPSIHLLCEYTDIGQGLTPYFSKFQFLCCGKKLGVSQCYIITNIH